ncbi:MAG TPA: glycosyltransferase family 4 protein [Longimicrobiales bacterium]|nr:glycosyltransferase family 4 protein [Longimicrobiales bacterium]
MKAAEARVALLTNFVPPYRAPVLRALAARVAALRVLVSTPMEANRDWIPDWQGLDVVAQRSLALPRLRRPSGFRERLPVHVPLDTRRRLEAFRPDVVVAAELGARSAQSVAWARGADRRVVIWATLSERTERGRGVMARPLLRRHLLARADGVVVNGESGARYVARYGYPADRIHRVAQASPIAWAGERTGSPSGGLDLVYVGQVVERKGLQPFIDGLEKWCADRETEARLTVVGPGSGPGLVERGLLRVHHVGPVPFEVLGGHYQAADLLVFPTLADEWGLVVNEAMASGLPVLGSVHSQAVTELVEEGRTGWRYDPEEPGDLEAALDRMASTGPDGLRRMGEAARRRVAGLTPESMGERLAAVLDEVLARGRRRP